MKYFQSLDNANNKEFVVGLQEDVGRQDRHRRRDPGCLSRAVAVEAAVEKAGSFDIDKVAAASPGIEFKGAPEGYVKVHENHHLWSKTRVGRARKPTASSRWSTSRPS